MAARLVIGAVALVAAALADAREARACSYPPQGLFERTVIPEDGATDVPRNARVLVWYDASYDVPGGAVILRAQGGDDVATTSSTPPTVGFARLLSPTAPLAPQTTYEIVDSLDVPCPTDDVTECYGPFRVIARFTTGTELDTTPPAIDGVEIDSGGVCVSDACPEGQHEVVDQLTIAATDDHPAAWIRYEYRTIDGELVAGPTHWQTLGRGCGGGYGDIRFYRYLETPAEIVVRAVDLAGNVETVGRRVVGATCDDLACEPDAGGGSEGGCATGAASAGVAPIVLAFVLGRRRRRDARAA